MFKLKGRPKSVFKERSRNLKGQTVKGKSNLSDQVLEMGRRYYEGTG